MGAILQTAATLPIVATLTLILKIGAVFPAVTLEPWRFQPLANHVFGSR